MEIVMTSKAERKAAAESSIREQFSDVDFEYRPSPWQWQACLDYVQWEARCDDRGWWEGVCPMQKDRRRRKHPARYNFYKGVMQCNNPDATGGPSCHAGKNMISLVNAVPHG